MTRITNVDQVMLLLQSRLQSKKKADKKHEEGNRVEKKELHQPPLSRVKNIAKDGGLSDDDIHQALVRGLLTEEFGASIANDPAFQSIIEDVMGVVRKDERSKKLLQQAMRQLQNNAM